VTNAREIGDRPELCVTAATMLSSRRSSHLSLVVTALLLALCTYACGRIRPEESDDDGQDADTTGPVDPTQPDASKTPGQNREAGSSVDGSATTTLDAGSDASDGSVFLPPIDPTLPDPSPACAAGTGAAYLVAENGSFYTWDPSTLVTTKLGTLKCPTPDADRTPYTMTVTQTDAYVMYSDWSVYRVNLSTLACTATPFDVNQVSYPADVGIATTAAPNESLLVLGIRGEVLDLAAADDLTTMNLREIGPVTHMPVMGYPLDTKVDGYGRLFGLDSGGGLVMINATTAEGLGADDTGVVSPSAWALLTYNDRIFFFTGDNGDTVEWRLQTKTAKPMGAAGDRIVGAGSAPCLH